MVYDVPAAQHTIEHKEINMNSNSLRMIALFVWLIIAVPIFYVVFRIGFTNKYDFVEWISVILPTNIHGIFDLLIWIFSIALIIAPFLILFLGRSSNDKTKSNE